MWPKILSLVFAAAALTGAVIYSQSKAEKNPKKVEVFDTSKSGTPTPWPDDKESPTAIKKKTVKKETEVKPPKQEKQGTDKQPELNEKEKDKDKEIMPSSKSLVPKPPVKKTPPPPT